MSLYLDLSEFLTNPITTGIQRIAGEICRHLPANTAVPVRLDSDHYVALPPALIGVIGKYFRDATSAGAAEIRRLGAVERGSIVRISSGDTVLVPEVFDNEPRIAFFREMPDQDLQRYRFIVYDLLPVTNPEYFIPDNLLEINQYYKILRRATQCGFISEATRDVYYQRLKRTDVCGGVVLPLGCDALGPRPGQFALNRPLSFTVLGTIEPRKNHALILDAFEPLLQQIPGLSLSFIGKMGWVDSELAQRVRSLASADSSGFRFHSTPDDETIRSYVGQSRATIYVSAAEGYGLPPVESLWLGTPAIASTRIPSLQGFGLGIHYVEPVNAITLRSAVLAFIEEAYASQKVKEAMQLHLPTWQSFTDEVLRWCAEA